MQFHADAKYDIPFFLQPVYQVAYLSKYTKIVIH